MMLSFEFLLLTICILTYRNYLTSWFLVDLVGTFPFERLIKGEAKSRKSLKLIKYFKIPKLLRISRLMKYVRDHKQVYDIFQVFVLVMTVLHLGACIWMIILSPCADAVIPDILDTIEICSQNNIYNLYAESFHLSASMMLGVSNYHIIGNSLTLDMITARRESDQVKMYIVSTVYMVGGVCLIAFLISELNVFLFGKKQGSAAFQRKIDRVSYELEYYGVPDDIQRQVRAFYDYIWIHQRQYDDKVALLSDEQMSTDLQRKLALHLFKDVISHISLFSEIDDLLLGEICLSLRTRIFLPHDMILFKGDVGKELFIIAKGVVEVLRDDLPVSERLKAPPIFLHNGSFFGEIALIMEIRRTCSVQARTICETNILCQHAFDTILQHNPDFARRMNELVVARQLERSLSKSAHQGDEVRVSNVDMENVLSAVERNMKKGLERRLQHKQHSCAPYSSGSSLCSREETAEKVEFCLDQQQNRGDLSQRSSYMSSISEASTRMGKMGTSSLRISLSHPQEGDETDDDVCKMIDDIARRSTTHTDVEINNSHLHSSNNSETNRKRANTNGSTDLEAGTKSKSPLQSPNLNMKEDPITESRRKSGLSRHQFLSRDDSICFENCEEEDAETMLITGHFNPKTATVDIKKVHPTILNSGKLDSASFELRLKKVEERLDDMMKSILTKIDNLSKEI